MPTAITFSQQDSNVVRLRFLVCRGNQPSFGCYFLFTMMLTSLSFVRELFDLFLGEFLIPLIHQVSNFIASVLLWNESSSSLWNLFRRHTNSTCFSCSLSPFCLSSFPLRSTNHCAVRWYWILFNRFSFSSSLLSLPSFDYLTLLFSSRLLNNVGIYEALDNALWPNCFSFWCVSFLVEESQSGN